MKGALALFVKTPSLSPVKTRLASKVGKVVAEEFYGLSVLAVASLARSLSNDITPYWAVAEKPGLTDALWSGFERIDQGEGGLGTRLNAVYEVLLKKCGFVFLMGADSPQIPPTVLRHAIHILSEHESEFVIGPCDDGGFYLFGGRVPIPQAIWEAVPYSVESTTADLLKRIAPLGRTSHLPTLFDVDSENDLKKLAAVPRDTSLTGEQQAVIEWCKKVVRAHVLHLTRGST